MNTDAVGNNNIKTEHRCTTNTVDPECRSNKNRVIVFTIIDVYYDILTCKLSIKNLFPRFHTVFSITLMYKSVFAKCYFHSNSVFILSTIFNRPSINSIKNYSSR